MSGDQISTIYGEPVGCGASCGASFMYYFLCSQAALPGPQESPGDIDILKVK